MSKMHDEHELIDVLLGCLDSSTILVTNTATTIALCTEMGLKRFKIANAMLDSMGLILKRYREFLTDNKDYPGEAGGDDAND